MNPVMVMVRLIHTGWLEDQLVTSYHLSSNQCGPCDGHISSCSHWLVRRPVSHFISSNAQSVSLLCITRPGVYMLASEWTATKCFSIALQSVYRFRYPPTTMGSRDVHGHKSSCITRLKKYPCTGELRTQKLKYYLVRTQSLNVFPLKPGVGQ